MCGICGIVYKDRQRPVAPELLSGMVAALAHRGPDDRGTWRGGNAGLGHTRLAILDTSPLGRQPMANEDGTVQVVFNGEIYNFRELRAFLESRGHVLRSRTDTEVLAHLWEEDGEALLPRLCGMFALAVWDARRGRLFLARDRFGKKPLYYADLPDRIVFASEAKAILRDPDFTATPDLLALHGYLTLQSVPAPLCAFAGMRKLPPAGCLTWDEGGTRQRRYWSLSYARKEPVASPADARALAERLREALRRAVARRLRSDVPLGAFLSGGLDSSMVVAIMTELLERPVKTFSIGFPEAAYDESAYARLAAAHIGSEHHELVVTPRDADFFAELAFCYDEPFADSSAIPTYILSRLAREYVTVALSGDGGDENFAGYPRYVLSPGERVRAPAPSPLWRDHPELGDMPPWLANYYLRITHFHELYQQDLYADALLDVARAHPGVGFMREVADASDAVDPTDRFCAIDFGRYLPDTLMTKVDIASMAHGLEVRCPWLDHELVEFAATIPSALKLGPDGVGKRIFKRVAEHYLPPEIIHRKKMGFGVPIDAWFRGSMREFVHDVLTSARARSRGYFRPEYVARLLARHDANTGEDWHYHIWNLLLFELWHLAYIDRTLSRPVGPARLDMRERR